MWIAIVVPGTVAAVSIWPQLRVPRIWFGLCLLILIGASIWVGRDLQTFVETRGTSENAVVRLLYTPFSNPDIPVLPLLLGSSVAGLMSRRHVKTTRSAADETQDSGNRVA